MKEKHRSRDEGFKKIHDNYNTYKKERSDVKNIYETIKDEYIQKLQKKELNFTLERVYIKMKTGWESDETTKAITNAGIGLVFAIFLTGVQQNLKEAKDFNMSFYGLIIAGIILGFIYIFVNRKSFIRDYNKKIYYKLCLDVLDELEKEKNEIR